MKTIQLDGSSHDLMSLIDEARKEPLLLLTASGEEFVVAVADDFEREVESLHKIRNSRSSLTSEVRAFEELH